MKLTVKLLESRRGEPHGVTVRADLIRHGTGPRIQILKGIHREA